MGQGAAWGNVGEFESLDGNLAGRVQDGEQWLRTAILGGIELGVEGRILNLGESENSSSTK